MTDKKEDSWLAEIATVAMGICSTIFKNDGSIDHRGHSGNDRTPAQKEGDKKRRSPSS
ncbi:MAG: hypothetical protein ABF759_14285 [Acetobacter malorum]|uniref:hypothetical protein n=1 Tax=Acetobacter malorum TaxID=178901 RepID=UPI0039E81968